MSKFTQYVIQFGTNFVDLTLAFDPDVTLQGQDIAVKGSNGVDVVYADGRFNLDFTESLVGMDLILLRGLQSDFIPSAWGNCLKLTRADGTYVIASQGDKLVFTDGAVLTTTWLTGLNAGGAAPALDASITSVGSMTELVERFVGQGPLTSKVLAYANGEEGNTFAQVQPGMRLVLKGTSLDDVLYVKAGSVVDFSDSLEGIDRIYLTGSWANYTKSVDGC